MTNKGLELIKAFEGLRLSAYRCSAGVWTIGYGHTSGVSRGDTIDVMEAERILVDDVALIERQLRMFMPTELTYRLRPCQWDAIVSFCFNCGVGAFHRSTLYWKIRADCDDTTGIRTEFMRWVKAGGKTLKGLERRRKAEADLYFSYLDDEEKEWKCNLK